MVPRIASSLVLFPDDFRREDVESTLLALRRARPKLLVVLADQSCLSFLEPPLFPTGVPVRFWSGSRPAFSWTLILDAIRERSNPSPP